MLLRATSDDRDDRNKNYDWRNTGTDHQFGVVVYMTALPSSPPSFLEDHVSQVPALQLLQNLGYVYLRREEVHLERGGKLSNTLLESVLEKQLRRLNRINFKNADHEFSDANIQAAIQTLKDVVLTDGLTRANERIYDLISLGKSFKQTIDGDT